MRTGTVHTPPNPSKPLLVKEAVIYRRRIKALGWSQNEAGRQIGKAPGLFSRWLRGEVASRIIRQALDARLAEAEAEEGEVTGRVVAGIKR